MMPKNSGVRHFCMSLFVPMLENTLHGTTILHQAAHYMGIGTLELLLNTYGMDPNALNSFQQTPLEVVENAIEFDGLAPEQFQEVIFLLNSHSNSLSLLGTSIPTDCG